MANIIIVSTNQSYTAELLQKKFLGLRGEIFPEDTIAICVYEDWPGGAGNALGTLYAFDKACKVCKQDYGIDLISSLKSGSSVLLYHTAGKGKRLAPLVFAEHNSKGSVQIPSHLISRSSTISVLEAVIYQTLSLAPMFSGRIASFWGDQIFLPQTLSTPPKEHINIFSRHENKTDELTWKEKGLENFGLIVTKPNGAVQNIDKTDFQTFQKLREEGSVPLHSRVGVSLGSFSLSLEMLMALMNEFAPELESKHGKFDSDPHLWMPATLDEKTYCYLMDQRGTPRNDSLKHWARIRAFLERFNSKNSSRPLFGTAEIGKESYWWDFGTVNHFFLNIMKLLEDSQEGNVLRNFLKVEYSEPPSHLVCKGNNILVNCNIRSGNLQNCILINVEADLVEAKNCLAINSNLHKLTARDSVLYHVEDSSQLVLQERTVRADIWDDQWTPIYTTLDRNGKTDWNERILGNRYSYDEIFEINESFNHFGTIS